MSPYYLIQVGDLCVGRDRQTQINNYITLLLGKKGGLEVETRVHVAVSNKVW